ncbi:MAG: hypothetical protein AAF151_05810 [Cyanobacteria bacterium J06656_5]
MHNHPHCTPNSTALSWGCGSSYGSIPTWPRGLGELENNKLQTLHNRPRRNPNLMPLGITQYEGSRAASRPSHGGLGNSVGPQATSLNSTPTPQTTPKPTSLFPTIPNQAMLDAIEYPNIPQQP